MASLATLANSTHGRGNVLPRCTRRKSSHLPSHCLPAWARRRPASHDSCWSGTATAVGGASSAGRPAPFPPS